MTVVTYTRNHTLPAQQTADTVRDKQVKEVEHLAAEEKDIFLMSWWRRKPEILDFMT